MEEEPREPELRELQEELHNLKKLEQSFEYKQLLKIAEEQIARRENEIILTPLKTHDAVFEQEFAKGEVSGIKLFTNMLPTMIETLESDVEERLKKEQENADENDVDETSGT